VVVGVVELEERERLVTIGWVGLGWLVGYYFDDGGEGGLELEEFVLFPRVARLLLDLDVELGPAFR
jgi:hypothetical protein